MLFLEILSVLIFVLYEGFQQNMHRFFSIYVLISIGKYYNNSVLSTGVLSCGDIDYKSAKFYYKL